MLKAAIVDGNDSGTTAESHSVDWMLCYWIPASEIEMYF